MSELPHLIIKKVSRLSQGKMEELARSFGNVERIYYSHSESDYPLMFVIYTDEASLYKAYCRINEKSKSLYEVTLKQEKAKKTYFCTNCMLQCSMFCDSCSIPYCSFKCQKQDWPNHYQNCVKIPNLVQMRWQDTEDKPIPITTNDCVIVTGFDAERNAISICKETDKEEFEKFLKECNEEAERSPTLTSAKIDEKVFIKTFTDQWFRGVVIDATRTKATVKIPDLGMTVEQKFEDLKGLKSKEIFFKPSFTRVFRLKGLKDHPELMKTDVVQHILIRDIKNKVKYKVLDLLQDRFIDLQNDDNQYLSSLLKRRYDRLFGLGEESDDSEPVKVVKSTPKPEEPVFVEPKPTKTLFNEKAGEKSVKRASPEPSDSPKNKKEDLVEEPKETKIVQDNKKLKTENTAAPPIVPIRVNPSPSNPVSKFLNFNQLQSRSFDPVMEDVDGTVLSYEKGLSLIIKFMPKSLTQEFSILTKTVFSESENIFSNTSPPDMDDIKLDDLCLVRTIDGEEVDYGRCKYLEGNRFENIDWCDIYEDVEAEDVRPLPRNLLMPMVLLDCSIVAEEEDQFDSSTFEVPSAKTIKKMVHQKKHMFKTTLPK